MTKIKAKAVARQEIAVAAQEALEEQITILDEPSDRQVMSRFKFVVDKLLRDKDARVRLATLELLCAYGYGKPVQATESKVETTQTFIAEVPPVQDNETWLKKHGAPVPIIKLDS